MLTFLAAFSLGAVLNIAKTVVGIGGLIFVHELGHFLVGRWCGVHAEAFSIGFGPVLLKWRGKPVWKDSPEKTVEYRLSAIPLGGYVKFLGENPDERGERDPRSFHAASYPRKVLIMLAGVTMNLLIAFALFFVVYAVGADVTPPVVGDVQRGSPAWEHGVRPGDEFVTIDGRRIIDFLDVKQESIFSDAVDAVLLRDGAEVAMRLPTRMGGEGVRQMGVSPALADDGARIGVAEDGAAAKAGFRANDRVVAVNGTPVADVDEGRRIHAAAQAATTWTVERDGERIELELPWATTTRARIGIEFFPDSDQIVVRAGGPAAAAGLARGDRPVSVGGAPAGSMRTFLKLIADKSVSGAVVVSRGGAPVSVPLPPAEGRDAFAASVDGALGNGPIRAWLADGPSPAREAALPDGCEIFEVDGKPVESTVDVQSAVKAAFEKDRAVAVKWRVPDGREGSTSVKPSDQPDPDFGGMGAVYAKRFFRAPTLSAVGLAGDRTWRWISRIFATLKAVLSGDISGTKLSGPVMIATGAYDQAKSSWADLFTFLGMISMNLAVLNVLPLPLLDGGQLAIHTIERIRGRAIPERVLEGVQWAGLVLLLSLMVYVIRNDIVHLMSS